MYRMCFALMVCVSVGCNAVELFQQPRRMPGPEITPTPTPLEADASACLSNYGKRVASAFENAADAFERHESSLSIVKRMGDELEPARIDSFMPPMQALTAAAPKPGATDDERQAADLARAKLLRLWASQLKGVH